MPIQIGEVLLNKYRIERMLGRGAFGSVYQATELRLGRLVAIKELRTELAENAEMLKRFIGEAKAIAALNNPHIVRVYTFDDEGDHHYMILEFMEDGSLAQLMKERGTLASEEAVFICQAVCDGLAAAHRAGIVHRDIKPANILLAAKGSVVKLSDFGIAHVPKTLSGESGLTEIGTTIGTVAYMAPEQARGDPVDARSDLYSVGAMLYQMVAGYQYLDFNNEFLHDLEQVRSGIPRPLPSIVPANLQKVIRKSLEKDPANRFVSAAEMSRALQPSAIPGTLIAVKPQAQPRLPILPIALGGVALLIILGLALTVLTPHSPTATPALTPIKIIAEVATATPTVIPPTVDLTAIAQRAVATTKAHTQATMDAANAVDTMVAATVVAGRPTATLTPIPSLTPTLAPTATPTQTPVPTSMPTATKTPIPTVSFEGLQWEPAQPFTGDYISFYVVFNNTFPDSRWIQWTVQIRDIDQGQDWIHAVTFKRKETTIPPGLSRLLANPDEQWRTSPNAGLKHYAVRAVLMQENRTIDQWLQTASGQNEFPLTMTGR